MSEDPDPISNADEEGAKAPDMIEAVEGWRAWGVPVRGPVQLQSVVHRVQDPVHGRIPYVWQPYKAAEAQCLKDQSHVPGENCTCGFYSAKSLSHLLSMVYYKYNADKNGLWVVVGRVANWGKVIPGRQGWRAARSYPVNLFVPYEAASQIAGELGEMYGVPVTMQNTWRKADEWAVR